MWTMRSAQTAFFLIVAWLNGRAQGAPYMGEGEYKPPTSKTLHTDERVRVDKKQWREYKKKMQEEGEKAMEARLTSAYPVKFEPDTTLPSFEDGVPLLISNFTDYATGTYTRQHHIIGNHMPDVKVESQDGFDWPQSVIGAIHVMDIVHRFVLAIAGNEQWFHDSNLAIVVVNGHLDFGHSAYFLAKKLRLLRKAIVDSFHGVKDVRLQVILTGPSKDDLQQIRQHPYQKKVFEAGVLDYAVFDIRNHPEGEPIVTFRGQRFGGDQSNIVFVMNQGSLANEPFDWINKDHRGFVEASVRITERKSPNGTEWRDADGCPDILRAYSFQWSTIPLRPDEEREAALGQDGLLIEDTALSLCPPDVQFGSHIPTGAARAVKMMDSIAPQTLMIVYENYMPPCLCGMTAPYIDYAKHHFDPALNIEALMKYAQEQLKYETWVGDEPTWDSFFPRWKDYVLMSNVKLPRDILPSHKKGPLIQLHKHMLFSNILLNWTTVDQARLAIDPQLLQTYYNEPFSHITIERVLTKIRERRRLWEDNEHVLDEFFEALVALSARMVYPVRMVELPD
eukprot:gnl/TRDRNA2_/TRDRNA2_168251_c0_seq3.p1 gnl/TRDRNA2_/TRDRNA2_168251_c0~~gnl/TRDRNA2_/TRDRNA2_168251_c0_seq3.p1  ORF type:complete len:564 (-),score=87.24 gnl/TRDRNA2_/TRDRNA2_168251_c0_seq3:11-1702(-)